MDIQVTVDHHGPVFDGRAKHALHEFYDAVVDDIAAQGVSELHSLMNAYFKDPTPYYETQVISERQGNSRIIHDRGIVYGPWLEGTGSRNFPATRFKGYKHWKKTTTLLKAKAQGIAEVTLRRYIEKMQ